MQSILHGLLSETLGGKGGMCKVVTVFARQHSLMMYINRDIYIYMIEDSYNLILLFTFKFFSNVCAFFQHKSSAKYQLTELSYKMTKRGHCILQYL